MEWRAPVPHLVTLRRFDLDNLCAVIGQDHSAIRPPQDAGKVDYLQPGQGPGAARQTLADRRVRTIHRTRCSLPSLRRRFSDNDRKESTSDSTCHRRAGEGGSARDGRGTAASIESDPSCAGLPLYQEGNEIVCSCGGLDRMPHLMGSMHRCVFHLLDHVSRYNALRISLRCGIDPDHQHAVMLRHIVKPTRRGRERRIN